MIVIKSTWNPFYADLNIVKLENVTVSALFYEWQMCKICKNLPNFQQISVVLAHCGPSFADDWCRSWKLKRSGPASRRMTKAPRHHWPHNREITYSTQVWLVNHMICLLLHAELLHFVTLKSNKIKSKEIKHGQLICFITHKINSLRKNMINHSFVCLLYAKAALGEIWGEICKLCHLHSCVIPDRYDFSVNRAKLW